MRLSSTARARLAVTLIFICVNFTGDMYILSLPLLSHRLHASQGLLHQTMTIFLLGMLGSFLISGSLIRRIDTYKSQIIGFTLIIAGTLCCLTLLNVKIIFLGRLLQGAGSGILMIVTRTILLSQSSGTQSTNQNKRATLTRHFSYIALFSAGAPILSIFLGGVISHTLGPQILFVILLSMTVLITISQLIICKNKYAIVKKTPETGTLKICYRLIQNTQFIAPSFAFALLCSTIPIFFISYAFIISQLQHTLSWIISIVSFFTTSGILLGKFLSYKVFPGNYSIKKIINYCAAGCIISSMIMCFNFGAAPSIILLIGSYTLFMFFVGLLSPATNAYIANFNPSHQEITVGLSMSFIYIIGVLENYLSGRLQISSELKLGVVLGVFSLTAMLINLILNSGYFHQKQQQTAGD